MCNRTRQKGRVSWVFFDYRRVKITFAFAHYHSVLQYHSTWQTTAEPQAHQKPSQVKGIASGWQAMRRKAPCLPPPHTELQEAFLNFDEPLAMLLYKWRYNKCVAWILVGACWKYVNSSYISFWEYDGRCWFPDLECSLFPLAFQTHAHLRTQTHAHTYTVLWFIFFQIVWLSLKTMEKPMAKIQALSDKLNAKLKHYLWKSNLQVLWMCMDTGFVAAN